MLQLTNIIRVRNVKSGKVCLTFCYHVVEAILRLNDMLKLDSTAKFHNPQVTDH